MEDVTKGCEAIRMNDTPLIVVWNPLVSGTVRATLWSLTLLFPSHPDHLPEQNLLEHVQTSGPTQLQRSISNSKVLIDKSSTCQILSP